MIETLRPLGWTGPTGAKITEHLHYTAATDNKRGRAQTVVSGTAEVYDWTDNPTHQENGWMGTEVSLPHGMDLFPDGHKARFLIINKVTGEVTLYWVTGYHPEKRYIGLKREQGSLIFDGEIHGPKKMYTLFVGKVERLDERNDQGECPNGSPTCTPEDPCAICYDEEN